MLLVSAGMLEPPPPTTGVDNINPKLPLPCLRNSTTRLLNGQTPYPALNKIITRLWIAQPHFVPSSQPSIPRQPNQSQSDNIPSDGGHQTPMDPLQYLLSGPYKLVQTHPIVR